MIQNRPAGTVIDSSQFRPAAEREGRRLQFHILRNLLQISAAEENNIWTQVYRCRDHPSNLMIGEENRFFFGNG